MIFFSSLDAEYPDTLRRPLETVKGTKFSRNLKKESIVNPREV